MGLNCLGSARFLLFPRFRVQGWGLGWVYGLRVLLRVTIRVTITVSLHEGSVLGLGL